MQILTGIGIPKAFRSLSITHTQTLGCCLVDLILEYSLYTKHLRPQKLAVFYKQHSFLLAKWQRTSHKSTQTIFKCKTLRKYRQIWINSLLLEGYINRAIQAVFNFSPDSHSCTKASTYVPIYLYSFNITVDCPSTRNTYIDGCHANRAQFLGTFFSVANALKIDEKLNLNYF